MLPTGLSGQKHLRTYYNSGAVQFGNDPCSCLAAFPRTVVCDWPEGVLLTSEAGVALHDLSERIYGRGPAARECLGRRAPLRHRCVMILTGFSGGRVLLSGCDRVRQRRLSHET